MISEEKMGAVLRGVGEAFGAGAIDQMDPMPNGLSSDLVFRIGGGGAAYLLKVMTRINEQSDPVRIFGATRAAAKAGIGPQVRYASEDDGVLILDFVESVALRRDEARTLIPATLRRLHGLARFPKVFNFVTAHKLFIWRFRTANLAPAGEVEEVFARYEEVCAVYPRVEADMVSSHQDLKPENVLFDGARVWLVDWQAAFVNDRYYDLAVVANFVVGDEAEETAYLREYFGRAADEYEQARFFLMRQVLHLFYAAVFLLLGAGGEPEERGFAEFHQRIWEGKVNLTDNGLKVTYGRVHWERLLENLRRAQFGEALAIVRGRNQGGDRLLPVAP